MPRNPRPDQIGMGGRITPEYAPHADVQRLLQILAVLQSCVAAHSFADLSGVVHGYELRSPYHLAGVGTLVAFSKRGTHEM